GDPRRNGRPEGEPERRKDRAGDDRRAEAERGTSARDPRQPADLDDHGTSAQHPERAARPPPAEGRVRGERPRAVRSPRHRRGGIPDESMTTTVPAAAPRVDPRHIDPVVGAIPVAIGICGLLERVQITSLPPSAEIVALVALYGAILAGSMLAPASERDVPAPLGRPVALAGGLAAVSLASIGAGRP